MNTTADASRVLFSDSFPITQYISVRHSTVGDVINLGEEHYFQVLRILTAIPSDEKYLLHQLGKDWMATSDLEFFSMMVSTLPKEDTEIFLPGIDFSRFKLYMRDDGDFYYSDAERGITIDMLGHKKLLDSLCLIHGIKKKVEKAGNATTKQVLIEEDKERREIALAKQGEYQSQLQPLLSSMVNRAGFKYDYNTVKQMLFGQFMDACARQQLIVATDQLIQGMYSGTVDPKKVERHRLDWTRAL